MSELTFYRQERSDQGVRSGAELDGVTLLENFQEGLPELQDDPLGAALEWYVDVRCSGEHLPSDPEAARRWLLEHGPSIEACLRCFAEAVAAGVDDSFPLRWKCDRDDPSGVRIEIVCSAVRRVTAQRLGVILGEFADRFTDHVKQLSDSETSIR